MMKQPGSRHGFKSLKSRVMVQGLSVIDRRSLAARALLDWKQSLIEDLGGPAGISTQKETLVELVVRTRLLVENIDSFILAQPSLVNKKRRSIYPIVRERQHLVDSLARMLGQLGLQRMPKDMGSLADYLEERAKGVKDEGEVEHSGGDGGRKNSGEDVQESVGKGHVGGVEDISGRVVRAPDDDRAASDIPEIHGQE
jgi:hypothetical protein